MIEHLSGREYLSLSDYLFAVLAGVTGVAGSYAVAGYTRRFIVAPIDALVVRMTPGKLVTFVIQNVGEAGHLLHISLSFVVSIGLLAATAIPGLYTVRRFNRPVTGVGLAGL